VNTSRELGRLLRGAGNARLAKFACSLSEVAEVPELEVEMNANERFTALATNAPVSSRASLAFCTLGVYLGEVLHRDSPQCA